MKNQRHFEIFSIDKTLETENPKHPINQNPQKKIKPIKSIKTCFEKLTEQIRNV
jgi:hypothetical protein